MKPDFILENKGPVSDEFRKRGLDNFAKAAEFIRSMTYARNKNKTDLLSVFAEDRGTCSTKHAVLKLLCDEQDFKEVELVLSLFKMNAVNTAAVAETLNSKGLNYIPEAHCYLKFNGEILDFTGSGFDPANYRQDILKEIGIRPDQITDHKVSLHKEFLLQWLSENPSVPYKLDELWKIREHCIADLSKVS